MDEPRRRGEYLRDRDGFLWTRGTRLWVSYARQEGRLPWSILVDRFGPMTVDAETERLSPQSPTLDDLIAVHGLLEELIPVADESIDASPAQLARVAWWVDREIARRQHRTREVP